MPDNPPTTHEENAARLSQAGKCLRDIEAGRFQCDEEKQQPTGELADEPATPEAVEQDTTEHPPDPQPLENEPPVSQTEAGYQKIRAELHEARKTFHPKTRSMLVNNWQPRAVNMSKTSATRTIRGGFITITAPQIRVKKKKWCRRENNQQQSRRLSPETRTGLSMYQRYSCPPQTRPKKRKPEQKEMEKRRKRATSRKRLAIQDRKLQRTVDQVQLHSAKPHASGAY
ncbi:Rac prophage protein [Salmonella enterica subsp. enterica serovar Heidelberg str. 75-3547]|nr:Rac prophage protein [Salmonella enterica subsp. enterica serovar Heidelberg str. 75-3547]